MQEKEKLREEGLKVIKDLKEKQKAELLAKYLPPQLSVYQQHLSPAGGQRAPENSKAARRPLPAIIDGEEDPSCRESQLNQSVSKEVPELLIEKPQASSNKKAKNVRPAKQAGAEG